MPQTVIDRRHADHDIQTKGQAPEVYIAEQAANMARLRGERELQVSATNIEIEYKRRLGETKDLATRLEKHLQAVRAELATAEASREQLMAVLRKVQCPLQLTLDWSKSRSAASKRAGRPPSASADGISGALTQSTHELKRVIESLTGELVLVDRAIGLLRQSEQRFVDELRSKATTMVLDRACLDGRHQAIVPTPPLGGVSPSSNQGVMSSGRSNAMRSGDVSPSSVSNGGGAARVQRALLQSHGLHTENEWRNQTLASLSGGVIAIEESKKACKRAAAAIRSIEDSGKTARPACVVDALQGHMKHESAQINALKYNTRMVSGEMATLDKHMGTVQGTLDKVRQQLQAAEHRLNLQIVRPTSEAARTGVEETLEIEVVNMKRTEQTLLSQLAQLQQKRQRLEALRDTIDDEATWRQDSLKLDQLCAAMQLPTLPQIADRYKGDNYNNNGGARQPAPSSGRGAAAPLLSGRREMAAAVSSSPRKPLSGRGVAEPSPRGAFR